MSRSQFIEFKGPGKITKSATKSKRVVQYYNY